ncbi:MAG: acyl-CoA dehydrogenase family protein, partial [Deltaproteobacteria bacterium]|nr:acyl-CoA dehydrogenase family protein [Deltaproteobacteria bacterium]
MDKLEGSDLFHLDDLLTDEQRMVRQSVRAFVDKEVMPVIGKHYRDGTFPTDLIKPMGALGMLGDNLHGYGCSGMDAISYGLVMQEVERADSGIRSFVSVQGALCMYPIHEFGSE